MTTSRRFRRFWLGLLAVLLVRQLASAFNARQLSYRVLVPQLIGLLDRYPTSLGFLDRSALAACTSQVVHLALDGVEPTPENLAYRRYPAWVELGRDHGPTGLTPAAQAFLEFIRSPAGERVLRQQGILPPIGGD